MDQSVTESTLVQFVVYCQDSLKLSFQTIKLDLCGIRHHLTLRGDTNPFVSPDNQLSRLHLLLSGIKRQNQTANLEKQRITSEILQDICKALQNDVFSKYNDLLMTTVCIVAFFGFPRYAEFTCKSFEPSVNLCLSDIHFGEQDVILKLKQSKTDPFRKGIDIKLFSNKSELCPFQQLQNYLQIRNRKFNNSMYVSTTISPGKWLSMSSE